MEKINNSQKKKSLMSYIYAGIIALLVLACGITIAFVNAKNTTASSNVNGTLHSYRSRRCCY